MPRLAAAIFTLSLAACGAPASEVGSASAPNILIILIDCLRADHVGAYGYERPTTPNLDALAAQGTVFERAIAHTNWTRPSVASLFSGLYIGQHRVPGPDDVQDQVVNPGANGRVLHGNRLSASFVTLAEALREGGYSTGAFINQAQMPPEMQFDQGFDVYDAAKKSDRDAIRLFNDWFPEQERFFGYVHLLGLHFPYMPRPRHDTFRTTFDLLPREDRSSRAKRALGQHTINAGNIEELMALYDATLLGLDSRLEEISQALAVRGLLDDTLVVVTSDHGEAFLEHGFLKHSGTNLHDEVLRVPLIMSWPGTIPEGTRVAQTVQLVDVMPTLLEFAGVPTPEGVAGRSLTADIAGNGSVADGFAFAEATADNSKALYLGPHKFIFGPEGETVTMFDLLADPGELNDLASARPDAVAEARVRLAEVLAANERFAADHPVTEATINPEDARRLRSLGYIQ